MRIRSMAVLAVCVVTSSVLAGCGPTDTTTGGPTTGPARAPAPPATSAAAAGVPVKDLTPGNCTLYPKASAVTLLGTVNDNNKALDIGTDGGTKIDTCSYLHLGGTALEGISYAVVRYDSASTAQTEVQKLQTEMLGDAADHSWPVQTLTTPAPGAGPVLGGTGTKNEQGVTTTIAVVGTNVGPYLVAALGGSTVSTPNAQKYALAVFQALNTAVG